jgi:hypothetical protein
MHYYGSTDAAHLTQHATHDWPPTLGVTGFHFHLGGGYISWRAGTQKPTSHFSTASELCALHTAPRLQKRCTKMDVRIFAGGGGCANFWWVGGGQRFVRLLRGEAARLVLKLRAGARRAARPSAMGGRINGLAGLADQKGRGGGHVNGLTAVWWPGGRGRGRAVN